MSNYKGTQKQPKNFGKYLLTYFETLRHAKITKEIDNKIRSKMIELEHLLDLDRHLTDDEINYFLKHLYDLGIDIEKEFNFFDHKHGHRYKLMMSKNK